MARPLRIEFEGALYHVTARGNARADIFLDDEDHRAFVNNLELERGHGLERGQVLFHATRKGVRSWFMQPVLLRWSPTP
jgi:hypothetical protein